MVNQLGQSVLTTLDLAAGAPPGYAGLAASLGVKVDLPFFEQQAVLAASFGQASLAASFNQLAPSKGHASGHAAISRVDKSALSRDSNPVDGSSFAVHIRAVDRLKQVSRLSCQSLSLSLLPCQCAFWCDICNAKLILEEAARRV